jgi:multicomponent Na+:H+ antiporter subunit D
MPITLSLYMVGAFSISAVPLFNGFISKTMIVAAAGGENRPVIELLLHLASIGTFLHTGLKLPWGTWFGKHDGAETEIPEAKEPPVNMLLAMGIGAFLCLLIGIFPNLLYRLLPYPVDFHPYTASRVVAMVQLLLLTLAAFWLFIDKLGGEPHVSLDTDWLYRIVGRKLSRFCNTRLVTIRESCWSTSARTIEIASRIGQNPYRLLERVGEVILGRPYIIHNNPHRIPIGVGACASLLLLCGLMIINLLK